LYGVKLGVQRQKLGARVRLQLSDTRKYPTVLYFPQQLGATFKRTIK